MVKKSELCRFALSNSDVLFSPSQMWKSWDYLTSFLKLGYSSKSQLRWSDNLLPLTSSKAFSSFFRDSAQWSKAAESFSLSGQKGRIGFMQEGNSLKWLTTGWGKQQSKTKEVTSEAWRREEVGPSFSAVYNHQINLAAMETCKQTGNRHAPIKYSQVLFEFLSRMSTPGLSNKARRSTDMNFTLKNSALHMWYG